MFIWAGYLTEPWTLNWLFMVYSNWYIRLMNLIRLINLINFILKFIMVSYKNYKNKKLKQKIILNLLTKPFKIVNIALTTYYCCFAWRNSSDESEVNYQNHYTKTYYVYCHVPATNITVSVIFIIYINSIKQVLLRLFMKILFIYHCFKKHLGKLTQWENM